MSIPKLYFVGDHAPTPTTGADECKNYPLTPEEFDQNFANLRAAIFTSSFKGAWAPGTPYNLNDEVVRDGCSYICLLEHTSSVTIAPPAYPTVSNTWWYMRTSKGNTGTSGSDAVPLVWKGVLSSPPASPLLNWIFRYTVDQCVYIYTGTQWEVMVEGIPTENITYGTSYPSSPSNRDLFSNTNSGILFRYNSTNASWDVVVQGLPFSWPTAITSAKLGYLSGVTSDVQTQINSVNTALGNVASALDAINGVVI